MSSYVAIACDKPVPDGGEHVRPCPQVWFSQRRLISLARAYAESAAAGWTHDNVEDASYCPGHKP